MQRPKTRRHRFAHGVVTGVSATLVATLLLGASACAQRRDPTVLPSSASTAPGVTVESDLPYREVDGKELALDACLPPSEEPTPAIILLHGGGFTQGSRSDEGMQNLCTWFAENGYAAFPVSYRLAPEYLYPSQTEDLSAAVDWLRDPAQAARFNIDPARIGALGSSAGAILTLELAMAGEGPTDSGSRIGAAISLSGVADMTAAGAKLGNPTPEAASLVHNYLGCRSIATCDGADASPITHVDASDPPTILVGSAGDLVPIEQAEALAAALESVGVPNQLVLVDGAGHGAQLMNEDVRDAILSFLSAHL